MGLFTNPLSHAGYPPNVTGTPTTQPSEVRAATAAEAAAGVLDNCYISPATAQSATALDFASPPVLGFGSTTPRPVHATTLSALGAVTINTSGSATTTIGTGGTGVVQIGNTTGNTAVTGSLTASTTLTASAGEITATNGNFVGSTAGTGLKFNANTATGAASGPVVLNSRVGQVIFSSVSIAAANDLTLTITNSEITASTTQVILSMSGATTGAALSIKSVTPSSGSVAIVVTNGTGATTTTANIQFNFLVVNT